MNNTASAAKYINMNKPLVSPKTGEDDKDLQELITFYNETLGFCPNSIKTMYHRPRIAYAFIEMNKAVMENNGRATKSADAMWAGISPPET